MNNNDLNHHDPETESIIEQLDALGSLDQSTPDKGFEQRVMDAISVEIAPAPLPITPSHTHATHFVPGWKFNIAAAILLVGSVSVLIWSSSKAVFKPVPVNNQQVLVSLEEDINALYNLDDFVGEIESDMDQLDLMTDAMHTELSLPSVLMELTDSTYSEGSL